MKLYYSSASPYVRKVMVTAIETGLESKIEKVPALPVLNLHNPEIGIEPDLAREVAFGIR